MTAMTVSTAIAAGRGELANVRRTEDRLRAESGISEGVCLMGSGSIVERLWTKPAIATIGFGRLIVSGRSRLPSPPAMTTAASSLRDSVTVGTLAGAPGFEPGITGPKPVALPLGHAPRLGKLILAAVAQEDDERDDGQEHERNDREGGQNERQRGNEHDRQLRYRKDPGGLAHVLPAGLSAGGHVEHDREDRDEDYRPPRDRPDEDEDALAESEHERNSETVLA